MLDVHIRWMIRRDLPEVMHIEKESFDIPETEEDFLRYLRQRNCIGMVAEHGERVVGFMIYELHKSKLHLLRMAVAPNFRRQGVARHMVEKLFSKLSAHRRVQITIELRESNLNGHLFLKALGFRATAVLRRFFEDSGEDAFVFRYMMGEDGVEFNENDSENGELEEIS